jgi:nitroreductase
VIVDTEDLQSILEAAVRAPSVHNTQPWRFAVRGDAPDGTAAVDVFADRQRQLPVIDPSGRELHISCGAAVEFAWVGARAIGRTCSVSLLPDPVNPDHLARLEIGGLNAPSPDEAELGRALPLRYTERGPFDNRQVSPQLLEEFRRAIRAHDVWLRVLDRPGDEVATAVLLAHADEIERANPEYGSELAAWTGERAGARDGVPLSATPPIADRGSSFRLREFAAGDQPTAPSTSSEAPPAAEHPLVVILGTAGDDRHAWLRTGQALGRVLLAATAAGLAASPMTQVLEVGATRVQLAAQLGLVGHPQVVLRIGYGHGHPTTPRRSLDDVIIDWQVGSHQSPRSETPLSPPTTGPAVRQRLE